MTTKKPKPPEPKVKALDVREDVRHVVVDKGAIVSDRINGKPQPVTCACCGNQKLDVCAVCGN